jgi:hypothetical protein
MRRLVVAFIFLALSLAPAATLGAETESPASGSFSQVGSLAEARYAHTASLLPDGRVLVIGGRGEDDNTIASAEAWDPATGTFGPSGPLAKARDGHTATLLPDGRVLVVGGRHESGKAFALAEVWSP